MDNQAICRRDTSSKRIAFNNFNINNLNTYKYAMILKNLLNVCVCEGHVSQTYPCLTIPLSGNSIFQEIEINVKSTLKHSTNSRLCMCILVLVIQIYTLE